MLETGYCSGIENYSRHLSGKKAGDAPETLLSYFPHSPKSDLGANSKKEKSLSPTSGNPDFLTIIDESHVTLSQLQGMYAGDASRKNTLVEYGFRLPSAKDNRPLKYEEFQKRIGQVIYTSATPSEQERTQSEQIVEQIIRPTGLVDPETIVRPVSEGSHFSPPAKGEMPKAEGVRPLLNPPLGRGGGNSKYPGQIQDFIEEAEKTIKRGFRVLATTLTKKMAEDLSVYLKDKKMVFVYITCKDDKEAKKIATLLLSKKMIACANIFPIKSIFSWNGKIHQSKEVALLAKTRKKLFKSIKRRFGFRNTHRIYTVFVGMINFFSPEIKALFGTLKVGYIFTGLIG